MMLNNISSFAGEMSDCRDPVADLQGIIANLFMILMPSTAARRKMCLTGISQPILADASVWYLWREDFPGVFQLELGEADLHCVRPGTRPGPRGRFWVKYFPALENDPCFDNLSVQEQILRLGPLFDATGTPVLETWSQLPEAAFVVGYLDLDIQEECGLIRMECSARDVWRSFAQAPVDMDNGQETVRVLDAGDMDRNMPGWALTWPIFDTLVTTLGLFYASAPTGCILWHADDQMPEEEESVFFRHLVVHLPCARQKNSAHALVPDDVFGLLQPCFDECDEAWGEVDWILVQPPSERLPWLNALWWQTSTDQELGDAGLCCLLGQHDPL